MTIRPALILLATAGLLGAACTSSTPAPAPTKAATSPTAAATTPGASPTAAASGTASATASGTAAGASATGTSIARAKISANTASAAEIQAALQAAGVPNPANWTREVMEYRPYPADDANLGKLRQNLAKYNPGPGVVDAIVSALKP